MLGTPITARRVGVALSLAALLTACGDAGGGGERLAAPTSVPVTTTAAPSTDERSAPALAAATTCRQLLDATEPQLSALLDALVARAATLGADDLAHLSVAELPEYQRFVEGTANLELEAARVDCTDAEQQASLCDVLAGVADPAAGGARLVLDLLRASC